MTKKQLDEISKKTLGSYIKKANVNYGTHAMKIQQIRGTKDRLYRTVNAFSPDDLPRDAENHLNAGINKAHSNLSKKEDKHTRKVINRERGISKATDRLTREETLDEISKDTLKNYIKKAAVDLRAREYKDGITTASDGYADRKARTHAYKKIAKRQKGLNQAVDKLAEDQLDELSKETLAAYIKRANLKGRDTNQAKGRFDKGQYLNMPHPDPEKDKFLQKHKRDSRNREKGINRAVDRLVKEDLDLQESLADLTNNIIFGSAGDAKQIFDDIAKGKIGDMIQAKREEVAAQLFADLKKTEKPEVQEEDADEDIELSDEDIEFLNSLSEEEINTLLEDEQLDELSKKTLGSYIKKASKSLSDKNYRQGRLHDNTHKWEYAKSKKSEEKHEPAAKEYFKLQHKVDKREKSIAKAADKLAKEDVEQVNEISKSTLERYIQKAKKSADNHYNKADPEYHRDGEYHYKKLTQRQYGIAQAKHKLDKAKE